MTYQRKMPVTALTVGEEHAAPKKYHVGYIAGVFDLFHVGHLNMFKRAKEQCDYLIVGVVNDESVMNGKRTMPYIPFEERIEIVRSCKYVDEAVEIPTEYSDTDEAYRRYQFDVQFSGSDYADDPKWLAKQTFLRQHGSDMVFFPYTQSTSSTKLKAMIEKKLL
jgi:cytidyltransferase-like protein